MGGILKMISRADVLAFSCVDKASRAYAEPILYAEIEWTWLRFQQPPIGAFLRTILHRPELASYVRSVDLSGDTFCDEDIFVFGGRIPTIPIAGLFLSHAIKAVEATDVPFARLWKRDLRVAKMDALVAVLLSQLHNLTRLVMCANFAIESRLVGMLFSAALCEKGSYKLPTFRHLRDVAYRLKHGEARNMSGRNTANALPFFYLPEIQTLSVALDNPIAFGWITHTPGPSTITSLDLYHIREAHLGRLLSVTPGLSTLRWDLFYKSKSKHLSNTTLIDLDEVATALIHVRHTLKHLAITAGFTFRIRRGYRDFPVLGIKGSLSPLVGFIQMERLEIPLPFLAGFTPKARNRLEDVVPRNIRCLSISDDLQRQEKYEWDDTALVSTIESWLNGSRNSYPKLNAISLWLGGTVSDGGAEIKGELTNLCNQYGLQAEINKYGWR